MRHNPNIREQTEALEQRLLDSNDRSYRGAIAVWINDLAPHPEQVRTLNQKNVARLKEIFLEQGCRRKEKEHRIPVLIDEHAFDAELENSQVNLELLLSHPSNKPPLVKFSSPLHYLHGQHRLAAAEQVLPRVEQWWIVDIYTTGTYSVEMSVPHGEQEPVRGARIASSPVEVKLERYPEDPAESHERLFARRWSFLLPRLVCIVPKLPRLPRPEQSFPCGTIEQSIRCCLHIHVHILTVNIETNRRERRIHRAKAPNS